MRVPLSWLLEYAAIGSGGVDGADVDSVDADDVARRLTACGLEVESVERVGYDITGVVVAEVLDVEELTGFRKPVRYCQVSTGDGQERHVICGATNFSAGDRVPLALPGATLPGGFEIGARKTYGKISEGMICSAAELAIGDDHSGIMVLPPDAPLGTDFVALRWPARRCYGCECHAGQGLSRCRSGAWPGSWPSPTASPYTDPADTGLPPYVNRISDEVWPASIEDPTACDRFVLREVRGIDPAVPTPLRMLVRLARAGQRSVSLAVDVTNYLMLELGQPLHAFDRDRLTGPIVVRRARPGERLETLDHVVRDLDPEDILITDSSGPISLAGTMGGLATEVTGSSRELVIEAAHFSARGTARMSRRHKLGSEASARFERGVDHELQLRASARAVALLSELAGGLVVRGLLLRQRADPRGLHRDGRRLPRPGGRHGLRARHRDPAAGAGRLRGHPVRRRDARGRRGRGRRRRARPPRPRPARPVRERAHGRAAVLAPRPDRPGRPGRGGHPAGGLRADPGPRAARRGRPGADRAAAAAPHHRALAGRHRLRRGHQLPVRVARRLRPAAAARR